MLTALEQTALAKEQLGALERAPSCSFAGVACILQAHFKIHDCSFAVAALPAPHMTPGDQPAVA